MVWAAELAVVWLGAMRMLCCALSVPAQWRCVTSVQSLPTEPSCWVGAGSGS